MLTHGIEGDIADHDDLVRPHLEGGLQVIARIFFQTAEQLAPRAPHSRRSITQAFARDVLSHCLKKSAGSVFNTVLVVGH